MVCGLVGVGGGSVSGGSLVAVRLVAVQVVAVQVGCWGWLLDGALQK